MSAPEQVQVCAACGKPRQPPVIGGPKPNDRTIKAFNGKLALICRECQMIHALDRATSGGRRS